MDFCRTGVMKDYSVGKGSHSHPHGGDKVATDPQGDKKISLEKRNSGETNYKKDPVTGQASTSRALSKEEAAAFRAKQKAAKLKEKQKNDDPGSKYDPSKDKVATDKMPTLPPKKLKEKAPFHGQIGPSKPDKKMNRRYS